MRYRYKCPICKTIVTREREPHRRDDRVPCAGHGCNCPRMDKEPPAPPAQPMKFDSYVSEIAVACLHGQYLNARAARNATRETMTGPEMRWQEKAYQEAMDRFAEELAKRDCYVNGWALEYRPDAELYS